MKFITVTKENIDILFSLNRQLATSEGQENLFSSSFEDYKNGFLGENPSAYGILCFEDDSPIGFAVYFYKFATYLGKKVLYVEDIYLKPEHLNDKNKEELFDFLTSGSPAKDCVRVEMRVMTDFSWGFEILKSKGFEKISKWSVYRLGK